MRVIPMALACLVISLAGPTVGAAGTRIGRRQVLNLGDVPQSSQLRADLESASPAVQATALATLSNHDRSILNDPSVHVSPDGHIVIADPFDRATATLPTSARANRREAHRDRRQTLPHPDSVDAFGIPIHHSNPDAKNTIFLNFQGEIISGTAWNVPWPPNHPICTTATCGAGYDPITVRPYFATTNVVGPITLDEAQRDLVSYIWQVVAEAYRPFDVDVTTELPCGCPVTCGAGGSCFSCPSNVQITTLTLSTDDVDTSPTINGVDCGGRCKLPLFFAGGVAFLGVFDPVNGINPVDRPAFVYLNATRDPNAVAGTVSHEAGHNFGLSHHGTTEAPNGIDLGGSPDGEYLFGLLGSYGTFWGPIMGHAFFADVSQWSDGSYSVATNPGQDDLAILGATLGLISDSTAQPENGWSGFEQDGETRTVSGVIRTRDETHSYTFTTTHRGDVMISAKTTYAFLPPSIINNRLQVKLHFGITVVDGAGAPVCTAAAPSGNAPPVVTCTLTNLSPGTYTVVIDGIGSADTWRTVHALFSDYGSVGSYEIAITPEAVDTGMGKGMGKGGGMGNGMGNSMGKGGSMGKGMGKKAKCNAKGKGKAAAASLGSAASDQQDTPAHSGVSAVTPVLALAAVVGMAVLIVVGAVIRRQSAAALPGPDGDDAYEWDDERTSVEDADSSAV